jgi:hypothetical protein
MTWGTLLFMGLTWAVILILFVYSLVKTLREKEEK